MKTSTALSIFMFLLWLIIAALVFLFAFKTRDNIEAYYSTIDLEFTGLVYEISSKDNTRGMLHLNLVESSVDAYDVRDQESVYLCVIKNDKADLITSGINRVTVGDTIRVDAKARKVQLIRDEVVVDTWTTHMSNTFFAFYFYRKLHKL